MNDVQDWPPAIGSHQRGPQLQNRSFFCHGELRIWDAALLPWLSNRAPNRDSWPRTAWCSAPCPRPLGPEAAIEVDLAPGDRIFLYTDGITDVLDARGEMLGNNVGLHRSRLAFLSFS